MNLISALDKIIVITIEENNGTFLAGGDALLYLPNQNTPQHLSGRIHLVHKRARVCVYFLP